MDTSEAAFPPVRPGSVHTDADAADGMAEYRGTAGPRSEWVARQREARLSAAALVTMKNRHG